MSNFKVGDKVKFISKEHIIDMTYGKIYKVEHVSEDMITVVDDAEEYHRIRKGRFELEEPFQFQVGDIVEFGGMEGKVISDARNSIFTIVVRFNDSTYGYFTSEGRYEVSHTKPLLNLVSRPKKKEKRVIKTKVYYSPTFDKTFPTTSENVSSDYIEVELEKEIEVEV